MTVEELLALARDLPVAERLRLAAELQSRPPTSGDEAPARLGYAALLELAGTAHSDCDDVSQDKLRHLGEAYADSR